MTRGSPSQIAARTDQRAAANRAAPGHKVEIQPPRDLNDDALEVWERVVPALAEMGALMESDADLLRELVESLSLARRYRAEEIRLLDGETVTEHDRNGKPYEVPAAGSPTVKRVRKARSDAMAEVMKLAPEFGLTPKSRMTMGLMQAQGQSLVDALTRMAEEG